MKKFNMNEFIWFVILSLIWVTVFFLYKSSLIYNYVSTKSEKPIIIALVLLGILCVIQCFRIISFPTREKIAPGNFIFIVALILILINKGQYVSSFIEVQGITLLGNEEEKHSHGSEESFCKNEKIVIKDNLHEFLHEFNEHKDEFNNKEIEIEGLVYKPEELGKEYFIIAKQEINCCAADAENIGIVCISDKEIKKDSNVKIKGKISNCNINFRGQEGMVPIIKVEGIMLSSANDINVNQ